MSKKGADDAGSGVAHSNIGLCHGLLGDYPRAAKHHQEALRVALRVQVRYHVRVGHVCRAVVDSCLSPFELVQRFSICLLPGGFHASLFSWLFFSRQLFVVSIHHLSSFWMIYFSRSSTLDFVGVASATMMISALPPAPLPSRFLSPPGS